MVGRLFASLPPGLRSALAAYALWRVPLVVALTLLHGSLPFGHGVNCSNGINLPIATSLAAWHRWDGLWYLGVIRQGYWYIPGRESTVNFFPLYPLLALQVHGLGFPLLLATLIVSHVSLVLALWGLYELAIALLPEGAAPRVLAALLCFPTAIFLTAAYTESTYLAAAVWGFVFFERRRMLPAALCAAAVVVTRANGVVLASAFVLGAIVRRSWREAFVLSLFPSIALGLWILYQAVHLGDPLAMIHVRSAWVGNAPPLQRTRLYVESVFHRGALESWMDLVACVLMLGAAIPAWRRFGPAYGASLAGLVLLGIFGGHVWGMSRFTLGAVPLFLLLGSWTEKPRVAIGLLAASLPILALEGIKFTHGMWAG